MSNNQMEYMFARFEDLGWRWPALKQLSAEMASRRPAEDAAVIRAGLLPEDVFFDGAEQ